jgi:nitronate monooxygenase
MAIRTRLTETLGIQVPILSAPMGLVSGGKLAVAISRAGGLGTLGAGAGDPTWMAREFAAAGNARIGCGFITWMLTRQPEMLDLALAHAPVALLLSFGEVERNRYLCRRGCRSDPRELAGRRSPRPGGH